LADIQFPTKILLLLFLVTKKKDYSNKNGVS
jgi:hypothetical protein